MSTRRARAEACVEKWRTSPMRKAGDIRLLKTMVGDLAEAEVARARAEERNLALAVLCRPCGRREEPRKSRDAFGYTVWLHADGTGCIGAALRRAWEEAADAEQAFVSEPRALPPEPPPGHVRVRIAVVVRADRDWQACARGMYDHALNAIDADRGMVGHRHTVSVLANVPLPPAPAEVAGVVEEAPYAR